MKNENTQEVSIELSKQMKYAWWRDNKMVGVILLISVVMLQVFAFLKVPVISSIHCYTIGMLMGYYNPFFYFYFAYFALVLIFGDKLKLPRWVKINYLTYWLVAISVIFVGTSLFFYQSKTGFTSIGYKPWNSFNKWFDDYTSQNAWAPKNTNGGILGAFLYSFFAMFSSGIGAIIFSLIFLFISVSLLASGTFFGLYKKIISQVKKSREKHNQKIKNKQNDEKIQQQEQDIEIEKAMIAEKSLTQTKNNSLDEYSPIPTVSSEDNKPDKEITAILQKLKGDTQRLMIQSYEEDLKKQHQIEKEETQQMQLDDIWKLTQTKITPKEDNTNPWLETQVMPLKEEFLEKNITKTEEVIKEEKKELPKEKTDLFPFEDPFA